MSSLLRSALLGSAVGSSLLGCGAAAPPAPPAGGAASLGAEARRPEIDDVDVLGALGDAKEKGCLRLYASIAPDKLPNWGTERRPLLRSERYMAACLAEAVAARLAVGDTDGARRVLAGDGGVYARVYPGWRRTVEALDQPIAEVDPARAHAVAGGLASAAEGLRVMKDDRPAPRRRRGWLDDGDNGWRMTEEIDRIVAGAKADACLAEVSEIALRIEARPGTRFAERLLERTREPSAACVREAVAFRTGAWDLEGARRVLADGHVKVALGGAFAGIAERLTPPLVEAEARAAADAANLEGLQVLVKEWLGRMILDDKRDTITLGELVTDMDLAVFRKRFPGAGGPVPADALFEKHYPGKAIRFASPGAGVDFADFMDGHMFEAKVERRFDQGPRKPDPHATWAHAFADTVRGALLGRFAKVEDLGAGKVRASLRPEGPTIALGLTLQGSAAVVTIELGGKAQAGYRALYDGAYACQWASVGVRWEGLAGTGTGWFEITAVHPARGTATVRQVTGPSSPRNEERPCESVPGRPVELYSSHR